MRYRIALVSILLLLIFALAGWFVWANSANRIPQGGVLVMLVDGELEQQPAQLVHPYHNIATRRTLV